MRFHPLQACQSWGRFAQACYARGLLTTDVLERLMARQLATWDATVPTALPGPEAPCTCEPGTGGGVTHHEARKMGSHPKDARRRTTMQEPLSNIGLVCEAHAPRPDPQFLDRDPASFVGHYVKIAFVVRDMPDVYEHMWCEVEEITEDGVLIGRLDNDPVYNTGYIYNMVIAITLAQIEAELWEEE